MRDFVKFLATVISIFLLLNLCPDYSFNDCMHSYLANRRVKDNDSALREQLGIDLTRALMEGRLSSTPDPTGQKTYNNILEWLKPEYGDSWREIKTLVDSGNWSELRDAFYTTASFGTAGMRGKMGVGTNRINIYAVRRVAQAVADGLKSALSQNELENRRYIICYDTREGSQEFAQETAAILAANGIKVAITDGDKPIGWFSHVIPEVNGLGGLMITASHNPVGNNGIKLSADYGGQLLPADGQAISDNYPKVNLSTVKTMDYSQAVAEGLITQLGTVENEEYIRSVIDSARDSRLTQLDRDRVNVVFDGLYGTARSLTPDVLGDLGHDVTEVEEHAVFDPNFTGLRVPNPTDIPALALARKAADTIVGEKSKWRQLTGNETWTLITEYLLSRMKESGESPEGKTIVKSWVTTGLITRIAERFGVNVIETPVGFKWIGALGANDPSVIAGFEESNGATLLAHSREKDGVLTAALFAEAVAWWNKQLNPGGETTVIMSNDADGDRLVVEVLEDSVVIQQLENIRREYGGINNVVDNTTFEGPEGISQRDKIVSGLAANPPAMLGAFKVSGINTEIGGVSDGVRIILEDGSTITLRKSGTEPILRIYVETEGNASDIIAAIKGYIAGQL